MKILTLSQFINEAKEIDFDLGEEVEFEDSFKVKIGKRMVSINPMTEIEVISSTISQIGFQIKGKKNDIFYLTREEIKIYGGKLV